MAKDFRENYKVQTGDLVSQAVKDYYDVFVCVIERWGRERGSEEEVWQVQGCLALSYKQ